MFLLGLIFGIALSVGLYLLLREDSSPPASLELEALLAKARIQELERETIARMLAEAEDSRRDED